MRGYTAADKIRYWLFQDRIPVTKLLILSNIVTFIAIAIFKQFAIPAWLSFDSRIFLETSWTAFTYPLVWAAGDPISLLFSSYWLWVAGGSLERSWGSTRFGLFFFVMSAISAIGLYVGAQIAHTDVGLANLWVPLAGLTVAFAMLNPEQQILFFFVIPLKLKYLALISAGLLLVQFAMISPLLGLFSLSGCAFSYWYVRPGRYSASDRRQGGEVVRVFQKRSVWRALNPFAWFKDWSDKRRLKKLFERSYGEDERGQR